jgi:hypothetical protein
MSIPGITPSVENETTGSENMKRGNCTWCGAAAEYTIYTVIGHDYEGIEEDDYEYYCSARCMSQAYGREYYFGTKRKWWRFWK